ncbi:hypothetical protein BAUCODRAFT_79936 [Baudoinia panamericana UAMH 10762]|uniref:Coenzyme Q-binding protein COQ10 START domain-containing protein n=1 Tax=Baudoinia panamericana (strain UAMH 10762) TaxID=717646 RepID=M2MXL6_BAUPA|nr:uncharacterized protein BAUCODRAFT_79936 [Baudoinia panamericana UAMH 10762]EMC91409.1 hypothetical protein BAUCODRAFT_79936 [Baudoinia panamericana UAMH 10762]
MQVLRPLSATLSAPPVTSALQRSQRSAAAALTFQAHRRQRRTFVSNPFSAPQTLTASRTLQYPSSLIYEVISDVGSYSTFLPYCQESVVTKQSQPASDGKQYPEEAKLVIGFNDSVSETFTSRVYCVPGLSVEAVSGETNTTLSRSATQHHSQRPSPDTDPSRKATVLRHLLTRWTLRDELPAQPKTEVNLHIEFQFANPVYAALSSAAAPRVAEKMIEAFERRVKSVIEGPASVKGASANREGIVNMKV